MSTTTGELYEAGMALERRRVDDVRRSATELLEAARVLGWGSGDQLSDAETWLHRVAHEVGIVSEFAGAQPITLAALRKQADRSNTDDRWEVWLRDGYRCRACETHRDLTVDHVLALANGGDDTIENKQTLCRPCNSSKGAR